MSVQHNQHCHKKLLALGARGSVVEEVTFELSAKAQQEFAEEERHCSGGNRRFEGGQDN